jgi:hypothetical protein
MIRLISNLQHFRLSRLNIVKVLIRDFITTIAIALVLTKSEGNELIE